MAYAMYSFNDGNFSFRDIGGIVYEIQPECLTNEQIAYELRLRGRVVIKDRRVNTGNLRTAIGDERLNPGMRYTTLLGSINHEAKQIETGMYVLRGLLDGVTKQTDTHDRFVSTFLHFDGRLNRLESRMRASDKPGDNRSLWAFTNFEQLSRFHNEFIQKIQSFRTRRQEAAPEPPADLLRDPAILTVSRRNSIATNARIGTPNEGMAMELAVRPTPQNEDHSVDLGQMAMDHSLNNIAVPPQQGEEMRSEARIEEPPVQDPPNVPLSDSLPQQVSLNLNANDFVNRRPRRVPTHPPRIEDIGPEQGQEIVPQFDIFRDSEPQINGTFLPETNARVSQQFKDFGGPMITPIMGGNAPQQFTFDRRQDAERLNTIQSVDNNQNGPPMLEIDQRNIDNPLVD